MTTEELHLSTMYRSELLLFVGTEGCGLLIININPIISNCLSSISFRNLDLDAEIFPSDYILRLWSW